MEKTQPDRREPVQDKATDSDLAWNPDVVSTLLEQGKQILHFAPVLPRGHSEFLDSTSIGERLVVGGRGKGKTTLLLYRAQSLKTKVELNPVRNVPPLGFRLPPHSITIPADSFYHFADPVSWSKVWKVVLGGLFATSIVKTIDSNLTWSKVDEWYDLFQATKNDELLRKIVDNLRAFFRSPHDEVVSPLVTTILASRPSNNKLDTYYLEHIRPILAARSDGDANAHSWFIFVDGIDESITDWTGGRKLLSEETAEDLANHAPSETREVDLANATNLQRQVWISAQAGYALASQHIFTESNMQLVVLGSMRGEAYPYFVSVSGELPSKLSNFVLNLEYPEDAMQSIFEFNISLMNDKDLAIPAMSNAVVSRRFCGINSVYNRTVFGFKESIFELANRHTFGAPRELVMIGKAIAGIRVTENVSVGDLADGEPRARRWRSPDKIMEAVNRQAIENVNEYLGTLYPGWDKRYEDGFDLLQSNIISAEERDDINRRFKKQHPNSPTPLFDYYFQHGLVGVPRDAGGGGPTLFFRAKNVDVKTLPNEDYLVLHPAFGALIYSLLSSPKQKTFYDTRFIVHPGRRCLSSLPDQLVVLRRKTDISKPSLRMDWRPTSTPIIESVSKVGEVCLAVLVVATKYYGGGQVDRRQFETMLNALERLGLVPKTSLVSKKNIFDNKEYGDSASQPNAIKMAKEAVKASTDGALKIQGHYPDDAEITYGLVVRGDIGWSELMPEQIEIRGLSSSEFYNA